MKHSRVHAFIFVAAIMMFVAVVFLAVRTGRGQSQRDVKSNTTKPVLKPIDSEKRTALDNRNRSNSIAAARNLSLSKELSWMFGGKQQLGWYLYMPLISRLIGTEPNAGSEKFASAVATWQKKSGLAPTGMLDEQSFYAMISQWQAARLKDRSPAPPDRLLTAPISDFYDESRTDELRQVEKQSYASYKRMIAAATADRSLGLKVDAHGQLASSEKYLKIISAFRSREYQDELRRKSPNAGSAGLAVNSPHFTGRALDIYVGGQPVETNDANRAIQVETPVYKWLVRHADRFGFRPYFYEPWHWEYTGVFEK